MSLNGIVQPKAENMKKNKKRVQFQSAENDIMFNFPRSNQNDDVDEEEDKVDSRNTSDEDGLGSSANGTIINHSVVMNEGEDYEA